MREHGLLYVRHKEAVDIPPCDSKEICSLKYTFFHVIRLLLQLPVIRRFILNIRIKVALI